MTGFDGYDDGFHQWGFFWIQLRSCCAPRVYNNQGLSIRWSQHDDAVDVEVTQLVISGKAPNILPGAEDSKIRVVEQKNEIAQVFHYQISLAYRTSLKW